MRLLVFCREKGWRRSCETGRAVSLQVFGFEHVPCVDVLISCSCACSRVSFLIEALVVTENCKVFRQLATAVAVHWFPWALPLGLQEISAGSAQNDDVNARNPSAQVQVAPTLHKRGGSISRPSKDFTCLPQCLFNFVALSLWRGETVAVRRVEC
jgi:hypothetical protein